MCVACHAVGGRGGNVGPALDGVADRRDAANLNRWLHDPAAERPGTLMPRLPLTDPQIEELVDWLGTLHAEGGPT
jgi:nitric oxide reductase subunit C